MAIAHALHDELHARSDAWRRERAHERLASAGLVPAREQAARQAAASLASLIVDWLDAGGMFTASRTEDALPSAGTTRATALHAPMLTDVASRPRRPAWASWTTQHRLSQRFAVRAGFSPPTRDDGATAAEMERDLAPSGASIPTDLPSERSVSTATVEAVQTTTPPTTSAPRPSEASLQNLAARFKTTVGKERVGKGSVTISLIGAQRTLSPDWATHLHTMVETLGSSRAADAAQRLVAVAEDPRWVAFPDDVLEVFLHFLVARCRVAQAANPVPHLRVRLDVAFDILRKAQQRHIPSRFVHGMKRDATPQRADNWSGEAEHYRQKLELILEPAESPIGRVQRLEARLPDDLPGFVRALKNARVQGVASDPIVLGIVDRHAHLVTDPDLAPVVADARRWRAQRETSETHISRDALWADVVRECSSLVLLPSARESFLDSPYRAPEHVTACLRAVNQVAARWKRALEQNSGMGEGLREAFKALGYTYKSSISDETRGRFGEQYRWAWDKDVLLFEEHITEAGGHDANRCFSLHFRFDKERRAVAVAHAGRHRQNTLS